MFISFFTFILIAVTTLLSTTTAAPHLQRRGLPGAYYTCTGKSFSGQCQWSAPNTRCRISGTGIASLGPDPGTSCKLYSKADCTGNIVKTMGFPGISDGLPDFAAFQCMRIGTARRAHVVGGGEEEGGMQSVVGEVGVGLKEVNQMERREQGIIGLEKGAYY